MNKKTYIIDDNTAFSLMAELRAAARHYIKLTPWVYRLFDGKRTVTFTTLEQGVQVELEG